MANIKLNNEKRIDEIVTQLKSRKEDFSPFLEIIGRDNFDKLSHIQKIFQADAQAKIEQNRLLRIGIVGQIKRGKSSLLNALLFDGQEILPKGATPMTAALTKLHYAKEPYAKLEFFTKQDWANIEQKALIAQENEDSGELSEEEVACLEIYTKAQDLNILSQLGKSQLLSGVSKVEDLLDKLKEYVGADGKYTPIVKSLDLGVNIDSIKNIEIIDTPGTNDPVVSRGRVTQDFMGQCDVIFFLSMSSQFLDQTDMQLLAQNIPNKGVENIYIIGSLFDSAMLDTYGDFANAEDLIETLKHKYTKRATEDIEKIVSNGVGIAKSLQKNLPPVFVSAMAFNIATHFSSLNDEESFTLHNLNSMYGDDFKQDDLLYIANTEEVQEKIENIRSQKDEILEGAFESVIRGANNQLYALEQEILESVKTDLDMLQSNDVESLEKKQKIIQKSMQKGKTKIDNLFTSYMIDIEKGFATLAQSIKNESKSAANVRVETGSYTETSSYEESTSTWYNPLSWGSSKTVTETETIYYKYASVYDAIEQLEEFVIESESRLSKTVEGIINVDIFRKEILKSIMGLFDMQDDAFDPSDIMDTLKNAIKRITIPTVDIDTSSHIDTIRNNFSTGEVKDTQIDALKNEVKRVSGMILADMKREIEYQSKKILEGLESAKVNFLPKLMQESNEKLEVMKKHREELEATLESYEKVINLLQK